MLNDETALNNLVEISEIKLADGWRGRVLLRFGNKQLFSASQWEQLLRQPEKLNENPCQILKINGLNKVIVKYLDNSTQAVIKRRIPKGVRGFFRSIQKPHSVRNFINTLKIINCGIPAALPLAAVYYKKFLFYSKSIFITEYKDGVTLYDYLKNIQTMPDSHYQVMLKISKAMAKIFAQLHKNKLWHRDAKASNFIIEQSKDGEYQVTIIDVDGIKKYFTKSRSRQLQGLWQLAASLMELPALTRTDYRRMFEIYCDEVMITRQRRGHIYRWMAQKAAAKYRFKKAKKIQ